ncbi:MAG: hypothetical protein M0Z40_14680 [Actinomycetota bacterium]|nr:hypothetical protein [Actinomycetota bacterium]
MDTEPKDEAAAHAQPPAEAAEPPTPHGRVDLARQRAEIERIRAEKSAKAIPDRKVTTRAVARIVADTRIEGRLGRFTVHSDEPPDRGGDDTAPSPLQFLMAAVAF